MERQKKKGSSVYLLSSRELKILDYRHWTRFHMAICPLCLLFRPEIRKEKEERGKREGQNTEMLSLSLYVTNVEINKSLWAVDRLWQGGAAHSSSTIYETVAAVCLSFSQSMCCLADWLAAKRKYCLKYLNVCVHFTPDLWRPQRERYVPIWEEEDWDTGSVCLSQIRPPKLILAQIKPPLCCSLNCSSPCMSYSG